MIFSGDLAKKVFKGFHNWYLFHVEQVTGQVSHAAYVIFQGSTPLSFSFVCFFYPYVKRFLLFWLENMLIN